MAGNSITDEELQTFRSIPVNKKIASMEAYLIGVQGRRYNMQEVAAMVFGNDTYSFTVSLIHRCYNFSGQNGGKYRNGCQFEQTYGYRVTREDIAAFIKQYPTGTFRQGITFEDFLMTRIRKSAPKKQASRPQTNRTSRQTSRPAQRNVVSQPVPQQTSGSNVDADRKFALFMLSLGLIGVLILVLMLVKGSLLRRWKLALFILFVTIGAFGLFKDWLDGQ